MQSFASGLRDCHRGGRRGRRGKQIWCPRILLFACVKFLRVLCVLCGDKWYGRMVERQEIRCMPARRDPLRRPDPNVISGEIIDAAMKVHSALGPGLLESAYLTCLAYELRSRSLSVEVQVPLLILYRGIRIRVGYRIDLLVENA
jgi:hypothetical protein